MAIYRANLDGQDYEVVTNPAAHAAAFHRYCQVYRLRKDGSRGMQLLSHHTKAYAVWQLVREQVLADEAVS